MVGTGREKTGSGSATMTLESTVLDGADGSSILTVGADVRLTGKIVRFGRGMIQTVAGEIIATFVRELTERMTAAPGERSRRDGTAPRVRSPGPRRS